MYNYFELMRSMVFRWNIAGVHGQFQKIELNIIMFNTAINSFTTPIVTHSLKIPFAI